MQQQPLFVFQDLPRQLETHIVLDDDCLIIPEGLDTIPCTHGIHRFAGKFIPNLPRYLIREVLPTDSRRVIFDPFSGSGTTLVEAALAGRKFIGLDIDPLAVFISRVKITPLTNDEINSLESFWHKHDFTKEVPKAMPKVPNLSHWFSDAALVQLSSIKARCLELPPRLREFSLVVFSSIVRRVSNADDQTQKTYVSHTLPKKPPLPAKLFPVFLNRALDGMREFNDLLPLPPNGMVLQDDSTLEGITQEYDDIITSPPYIDSIDYMYNQMLEYYWLLDELGVGNYENFKALRKRPMGFRIYSEKSIKDELTEGLGNKKEEFDQICSHIETKSRKEAMVVRTFFFDYCRHVRAVRAGQSSSGCYVSVVGNSRIRGLTVPTVDFIQAIHINFGYRMLHRWRYEIKRHYMKFPRRNNSGKIDQDAVLVFEAS